jgi:hypothetical protein
MRLVPLSLALPVALAIGVLPVLRAQTVAPRRVTLRFLIGGAVPVAPSQFRSDWNPGFSSTASLGYSVLPRVELALAIEYGSFGLGGAPAPPPPPALITTRGATPLWAAWLDGAFMPSSGRVRPRVHLGAGVVAHGAARTAPALQIGVGVERSLGTRTSAYLDATLAHAFTSDPSGQAGISEPLSYAPIRLGLAWR